MSEKKGTESGAEGTKEKNAAETSEEKKNLNDKNKAVSKDQKTPGTKPTTTKDDPKTKKETTVPKDKKPAPKTTADGKPKESPKAKPGDKGTANSPSKPNDRSKAADAKTKVSDAKPKAAGGAAAAAGKVSDPKTKAADKSKPAETKKPNASPGKAGNGKPKPSPSKDSLTKDRPKSGEAMKKSPSKGDDKLKKENTNPEKKESPIKDNITEKTESKPEVEEKIPVAKDTTVTTEGNKTVTKLEDETKPTKEDKENAAPASPKPEEAEPDVNHVKETVEEQPLHPTDVELQAPLAKQEENGSKQTTTPSGISAKDEEKVLLTGGGGGLNARLLCAILAVALGSAFQHGYNLGVMNAPLELMGDWLNTTSYNRTEEYLTQNSKTMIISWIVSIYCIGGMIGGAFTGFFSERFGRKGGLLINNVFAFIAAILFGFCKMAGSWEMIVAGRFFIGINNGLNAGLAPMYLSEIAPTNLRGAIGTVYQLAVTISILFSQIMGLESILGTVNLWPILLALTAGPAVFQLFVLPICPESPKFLLINKGKQIEAQRALSWLRDSTNVHDEMEEMMAEAEAQKLVPTVSVREIVTNPILRIPLVISLMMMLAQQLSGINAVIFFSTKIYESAGLSEEASLYATIAMGAMNVLMTIISLVMVEKAGRKTLMLTGLSGMLIVSLLLTICLALKDYATWISYFSILLVILFVVMFATGPGSIPWFLVNELFASNARPIAASIAVAVNWTAAFLVGLLFLPVADALGPYVFLVFVAILAFFIGFTWKKVPETKGRSIDEITALFKQQAYGSGNSV